MLRPNIGLIESPHYFFTPRRLAIVTAVGVLHVMLVYALVSGLATRLVLEVPNIINAEVIPQPDITKPPPPPAPATKDFETPVMPTVAAPEIKIAHTSPSPITVVQGPPVKVVPVVRQTPPVVVVAPAAVLPTLARAVAGTHTQPAYPDIARRLNEQGTVHLNIAVGADGRVGQVLVTQSSGSDRLDRAAVDWVASHWRYEPATMAGKPVSAMVKAAIVFNLTQARR